jgi:ketosteroid isomerase-like protein
MLFRFFFVLLALLACTIVEAKQAKSIGKIKTATETPIDPVAARKGIEATNQAFIIALKKHDAKVIADTFEADAVLLPQGADAVHGRDAISKYFAGLSTIDDASTVTLDVIIAASTAYETGVYTMTMHAANAPPVADHGKYLCIWKFDEDKRWRIARQISNTSVANSAATSATGNSSQR